MPTRRLPNSVPAVLRVLRTAADTAANTPETERAITPAHLAQITLSDPGSLLSRLLKESSEADIAQAIQRPLTNAQSQAAARTTILVSHFHQVLDLGILRGDFAAGARSYYGRPVSATSLPDLSSYAIVKEAAEKIATGESARLAAEGAATFLPMALPSAAQIASAAATFQATATAAQTAQIRTDYEAEDVLALYPAAQALAVDICDTVEFFYRSDKEPGSFRRKCRRWGVVYYYEPHETPDPEDLITTPESPTNPPTTPA